MNGKIAIKALIIVLIACMGLLILSACDSCVGLGHEHVYDQTVNEVKYRATMATCDKKATYYYSCKCGEKDKKTFEYGSRKDHSFTTYISDNNANEYDDGTKTAYCDYGCGAKNTVIDVGSKKPGGIYKVEYYLENVYDSGYTKTETLNLRGAIGSTVYAEIKSFAHFTPERSSVSGTVNSSGSLVLKVYYQRNEYVVTFDANGGSHVSGSLRQTVKYQGSATAPTFSRSGYTYTFDKSYTNVSSNITVKAIWTESKTASYKVEYYLESVNGYGYDLNSSATQYLTGNKGSTVYAEIKSFRHYEPINSSVSGTVNASGTLVLKVYYKRNHAGIRADSSWQYVTKPTVSSSGLIKGRCVCCSTMQNLPVPSVSEENGYVATPISLGTCTTKGWVRYTKIMPDSFEVNISVQNGGYGHEFNGETIDIERAYTEEEVDILGLTKIANALGNCMENGEAVFVCDNCGKTYKISFIGNHSHSYGAIGILTEPTCQERGYTTYTCKVCNKTYRTEYVDRIPHDWEIVETKEISSSKVNLIFECASCHDSMTITNATLTGSRSATCNEEGYKTYEYANPNYDSSKAESSSNKKKLTITLTYPKLKTHRIAGYTNRFDVSASTQYYYGDISAYIGNGMEYISNVEVTCSIPGEGVFKCADCNKTYKISVYADHDFTGNSLVTPAASCKGDQYATRHCNTCGEDIKISKVEKTSHKYQVTNKVEYYNYLDVTLECSMCGDEITRRANLVYSESVEPTCMADGKNVYKYLDPNNSNNYDSYTSNDVYAKIEIAVPKTSKHVIRAGQDPDVDGFDVSGAVRYEYDDIEKYIGSGLNLIANADLSCTNPCECVFTCAHCSKTYKINIYDEHNYKEVDRVNIGDGTYDVTYECTDCGDTKRQLIG